MRPSEAQWEYVCRAGTETATYAREMRIVGANNAPVLDAIAWYWGNGGVTAGLRSNMTMNGPGRGRLASRRRTRGAFTTCWAMCGSGVRIIGTVATRADRPMALPGLTGTRALRRASLAAGREVADQHGSAQSSVPKASS